MSRRGLRQESPSSSSSEEEEEEENNNSEDDEAFVASESEDERTGFQIGARVEAVAMAFGAEFAEEHSGERFAGVIKRSKGQKVWLVRYDDGDTVSTEQRYLRILKPAPAKRETRGASSISYAEIDDRQFDREVLLVEESPVVKRKKRKSKKDESDDEEEEASDEDESEDPSLPPLEIERILARCTASMEVWRSACFGTTTAHVTHGSMWLQLQQEGEEGEAEAGQTEKMDTGEEKKEEDVPAEERFLVKWKGLSYLHVSWETRADLETQIGKRETQRAMTSLQRREENGEAPEELESPLEKADLLESACFDVERVLDVFLGPEDDDEVALSELALQQTSSNGANGGRSKKTKKRPQKNTPKKKRAARRVIEDLSDDDDDDEDDEPEHVPVLYALADLIHGGGEKTNPLEVASKCVAALAELKEQPRILVKWRGLGYFDSTTETLADAIEACVEKRDLDVAVFQCLRRYLPNQNRHNNNKSSSKQPTGRQIEAKHRSDLEAIRASIPTTPHLDPLDGFTLRKYQIEGVQWLAHNFVGKRSCVLADEMGLGKTVQSVTLVRMIKAVYKAKDPALIVAPLSTLEHWQREFALWTPLDVCVYHGGQDDRETARDCDVFAKNGHLSVDVVVTTYEQLLLDDARPLAHLKYSVIIVDEAHRLKNPNARLYKALTGQLAPNPKRRPHFQARIKLLLTGTPLQNDVKELWAILSFCDPTAFPDVDDFVTMYGACSTTGTNGNGNGANSASKNTTASTKANIKPPKKKAVKPPKLKKRRRLRRNNNKASHDSSSDDDSSSSSSSDEGEEDEEEAPERDRKEVLSSLLEAMRPYVLRREKAHVEKSVPPKSEIVVDVALAPTQKRCYRALYEKNVAMLAVDGARDGPALTNLAMELRKCCNHPFLLKGVEASHQFFDRAAQRHGHQESPVATTTKDEVDVLVDTCGKLQFLDKLLPKLKAQNSKLLIFSQFTMMLNVLEDYLEGRGHDYGRIDGGVTGRERQRQIDDFCKDDSPKFVMLLSTRAGGVGINLVAADTVVIYDSDWNPQNDVQAMARCHRIGQTKPVTVYRLLTSGTYEAHMYDVATAKLDLDRAVLDGMASRNTTRQARALNENLLRRGARAALSPGGGGRTGARRPRSSRGQESSLQQQASSLDDTDMADVEPEPNDLDDDDEDADEDFAAFKNQDLDAILATRSRQVVLSRGAGGGALESLSKATFVANTDPGDEDVDLDDPDFWKKTLGDALERHEEAVERESKDKSRAARTRVNSYNDAHTGVDTFFDGHHVRRPPKGLGSAAEHKQSNLGCSDDDDDDAALERTKKKPKKEPPPPVDHVNNWKKSHLDKLRLQLLKRAVGNTGDDFVRDSKELEARARLVSPDDVVAGARTVVLSHARALAVVVAKESKRQPTFLQQRANTERGWLLEGARRVLEHNRAVDKAARELFRDRRRALASDKDDDGDDDDDDDDGDDDEDYEDSDQADSDEKESSLSEEKKNKDQPDDDEGPNDGRAVDETDDGDDAEKQKKKKTTAASDEDEKESAASSSGSASEPTAAELAEFLADFEPPQTSNIREVCFQGDYGALETDDDVKATTQLLERYHTQEVVRSVVERATRLDHLARLPGASPAARPKKRSAGEKLAVALGDADPPADPYPAKWWSPRHDIALLRYCDANGVVLNERMRLDLVLSGPGWPADVRAAAQVLKDYRENQAAAPDKSDGNTHLQNTDAGDDAAAVQPTKLTAAQKKRAEPESHLVPTREQLRDRLGALVAVVAGPPAPFFIRQGAPKRKKAKLVTARLQVASVGFPPALQVAPMAVGPPSFPQSDDGTPQPLSPGRGVVLPPPEQQQQQQQILPPGSIGSLPSPPGFVSKTQILNNPYLDRHPHPTVIDLVHGDLTGHGLAGSPVDVRVYAQQPNPNAVPPQKLPVIPKKQTQINTFFQPRAAHTLNNPHLNLQPPPQLHIPQHLNNSSPRAHSDESLGQQREREPTPSSGGGATSAIASASSPEHFV